MAIGALLYVMVDKWSRKYEVTCNCGLCEGYNPIDLDLMEEENDLLAYSPHEIKKIVKDIKTPDDILRYKQSKTGYYY